LAQSPAQFRPCAAGPPQLVGLDAGRWVLFLILFAWQHPHFYAIAWMFKDDYRDAGFRMLPVVDPSGASTFRQTILFAILLLGRLGAPHHHRHDGEGVLPLGH